MALTGKTTAEKIWNFLIGKGLSAHGVAGLMGNLYAESALNPQNLQNSYERKLGYSDAGYTEAVDSGSYTNFVNDAAGYGLAQWTHRSRKEKLLAYVRASGDSVGDLEAQLCFLWKELGESYGVVLKALRTADNVREASDIVLTKFEKPANQSTSVQVKRASYGQKYYDKFAGTAPKQEEPAGSASAPLKAESAESRDRSLSGTYMTTANLNMRTGAGTDKPIMLTIPKGSKVQHYGYYTAVNGVKWLYVIYNGVTGFCSYNYLVRR